MTKIKAGDLVRCIRYDGATGKLLKDCGRYTLFRVSRIVKPRFPNDLALTYVTPDDAEWPFIGACPDRFELVTPALEADFTLDELELAEKLIDG